MEVKYSNTFQTPRQNANSLSSKPTNIETTFNQYLAHITQFNLPKTILPGFSIVTTLDEFKAITKIRKSIFKKVKGLSTHFPTTDPQYSYDEFDKKSINIIGKNHSDTYGTIRIVADPIHTPNFDFLQYLNQKEKLKLQTETKKHKIPYAELSRLAITQNKRGQHLSTKFFQAATTLAQKLDIGALISSMKQTDYHKYYKNLEMEIMETLSSYGQIPHPAYITKWHQQNYSKLIN